MKEKKILHYCHSQNTHGFKGVVKNMGKDLRGVDFILKFCLCFR